MKRLVLILCVASLSINSMAQKITSDNVPQLVITAFNAKFPTAKKSKWEMDYDKYDVDFKVGKDEYTAKFQKDGKWLETVSYLKPSQLPKLIKESLAKNYSEYSGYKVEEAEKVENEKGNIYVLEVKKADNTYKLEFDEQGEILKEERKSEASNN